MISPWELNEYPTNRPSLWKIIWWELQRKQRFENKETEDLFNFYTLQYVMPHMTHLLSLLLASSVVMVGSILAWCILGSCEMDNETKIFHAIFWTELVIMIVYTASYCETIRRQLSGKSLIYISNAILITFLIQELVLSHTIPHLWATIFFVYVTYALLPLRLLDTIMLGLLFSFIHVPFSYYYKFTILSSKRKEIISEILLITAANILGMLTHFPNYMAQRKAFIETAEYIKAKITIQQETMRQETLLLSLLPHHLVGELQESLIHSGTIARDQIYMETYSPVSILYADIMGFTQMADSKPVQQVVEVLNDLYCSFDRLADNYCCMRIKLLGDCYYCITGLPMPSSSDADNIVDMGLSMVPVVETVAKRFKTNIKIRVGIHTGKVHCGVLGVKRQQFDIWSTDVTLANLMESAGLPGKVHITHVTKEYLIKNYRFEPAFGEKREPALKGITTYFVTAITSDAGRISGFPFPNPLVIEFKDASHLYLKSPGTEREVLSAMHTSLDFRSFRQLKEINCRSTTLTFRDWALEKMYNKEPDRMLQSYFITSFLLYVIISVMQFILFPKRTLLLTCFGIGFSWVTFVAALVLSNNSKISLLRKASVKVNTNRVIAQALAIITVFICYITLALPMALSEAWQCSDQPDFIHIESDYVEDYTMGRIQHQTLMEDDCILDKLPYSEYALLYTVLIMEITGAFQIIVCLVKVFVMILIVVLYILLFFSTSFFFNTVFNFFLMVILLSAFLLLLLIHSQQSEIIHRLDFVWKMQAMREKEDVQCQQKINEMLINNILPTHVARHFLRINPLNEELYYEQCDSTCVLFACISNFSFLDVSPHQSMSVLHDIISDFDEILSEPSFHGIEKIKSTGAVYIAASGLSTDVQDQPSVDHVTVMADFALRLKEHLHVLNERHKFQFKIKIGMHMGPLVAGVIGAKKPQYDIWGDTVNVASRMYSTGIDNEIQMTTIVSDALKRCGYTTFVRGMVSVKGKGGLLTHILVSAPERQQSSNEVLPTDSRKYKLRKPIYSTDIAGQSAVLLVNPVIPQSFKKTFLAITSSINMGIIMNTFIKCSFQ